MEEAGRGSGEGEVGQGGSGARATLAALVIPRGFVDHVDRAIPFLRHGCCTAQRPAKNPVNVKKCVLAVRPCLPPPPGEKGQACTQPREMARIEILLWAALVSSCACGAGAETPQFHLHAEPWGQRPKLWRDRASASMGALRLVGADRISIRGGGLAEDVAGMEIQKGGGDDEWAKELEAKLKMVNVSSESSSLLVVLLHRACLSLPLGTSSSLFLSCLRLVLRHVLVHVLLFHLCLFFFLLISPCFSTFSTLPLFALLSSLSLSPWQYLPSSSICPSP